IDSDLTYLSHYANSYSNPTNPYVLIDPATGLPVPDPDQRHILNYATGNDARMEVFSTDNNLQIDFNTGSAVEHVVLTGVDYSWNRVRKEGGAALELIDIYDIDRDSLSDFGGSYPVPGDPGF